MSAIATTPTAHVRAASRYHVTFPHLLKSEWIKLRSLRSTWWTLGITVVMMVLISLMLASQANWLHEQDPTMPFTGLDVIVQGYVFVQLSVAVLGALVITGEYSTGMIRSTLSAAPTRLPALWAKTLITAGATAVTAVLGLALSYAVTTPMLAGNGLEADLADATSWRVLGMTVACLAIVAIMSVGVGTILRHSAGAIFTLVALLFVLPMVGGFFSQQWVQEIFMFLPGNASSYAVATVDATGPASLTIAEGALVMAGWAILSLGTAAVMLKKRAVHRAGCAPTRPDPPILRAASGRHGLDRLRCGPRLRSR